MRIAKLRRHLGPDAIVDVVEIQTGSKLIKLAAWVGILGGVASMASCGMDLVDRMEDPGSKIGRITAQIMVDFGSSLTSIVTSDGHHDFPKDKVPAVGKLLDQRRRGLQSGWGDNWGNDYGGTKTLSPGDGTDLNQTDRFQPESQRLRRAASAHFAAIGVPTDRAADRVPDRSSGRDRTIRIAEAYRSNGDWFVNRRDGADAGPVRVIDTDGALPSDADYALIEGQVIRTKDGSIAFEASAYLE